ATRNADYLHQAERIMDVIMDRMTDAETGWVLELFDEHWNYMPRVTGAGEIDMGHNIEVAWSLLRLHLLNDRKDYLETGLSLAERVQQRGVDEATVYWFGTIGKQDAKLEGEVTQWWSQAYGIMFDLGRQHGNPEANYGDDFKKGAAFWDE